MLAAASRSGDGDTACGILGYTVVCLAAGIWRPRSAFACSMLFELSWRSLEWKVLYARDATERDPANAHYRARERIGHTDLIDTISTADVSLLFSTRTIVTVRRDRWNTVVPTRRLNHSMASEREFVDGAGWISDESDFHGRSRAHPAKMRRA